MSDIFQIMSDIFQNSGLVFFPCSHARLCTPGKKGTRTCEKSAATLPAPEMNTRRTRAAGAMPHTCLYRPATRRRLRQLRAHDMKYSSACRQPKPSAYTSLPALQNDWTIFMEIRFLNNKQNKRTPRGRFAHLYKLSQGKRL